MNALILVVDDEGPLADLVASLLFEEGYRVAVAYDGLSGFETALRLKPNLIVSDVQMPKLDGMTLLRRLRSVGNTAPVILMSAVYIYETGILAHFIPKPFDLDHLLEVVHDALNDGTQAP